MKRSRKSWGERGDSNPQQLEPQSSALTIELRSPYKNYYLVKQNLSFQSTYVQAEQHSFPATRMNGAPDRIRTCGLLLRRQLLYPAELQAQLKKVEK